MVTSSRLDLVLGMAIGIVIASLYFLVWRSQGRALSRQPGGSRRLRRARAGCHDFRGELHMSLQVRFGIA
jgi:MFS superfamily sulfate permease-like transporter